MPPTLAEARVAFIKSLKASERSPGTLALYERCLKELEDWLTANDQALAVDAIESRHITDFPLYLAERPKRQGHGYRSKPEGLLATETKRHYHRVMSSFFNWCQREGLLNGHMPMRNIKKPRPEHKEIRTLSDQEVKRFLDLLHQPEAKKRTLYVAFSLMYKLGLRISEVCNLRLSDLNLETGRLFVQGKGKKERELPIRNGVDKMLEA
ncbi:MAG: hypothetical protein CEE40_07625 [Chloroflexi bacterium B3_Chlor]|nr:MAG: hypothetical protein CEE40_07625 [Chloroflexi bacterium B3_Chlor]